MKNTMQMAGTGALLALLFYLPACMAQSRPIRILLIGNSYSYYNAMPHSLEWTLRK
jgi:hypothetical protein